ncbi:unnamed protein product [Mytilus coruscus]|uniref:Sema domain-containing protein n=1 Tax=Mytilus coruscus TaxID=42192 RepID=A0A6J8B8E6_MYTCO|nr:unnamed protein product [Mytilus coruscus]
MVLSFLCVLIGIGIINEIRCIYSIPVFRNYNEKFRNLALTSDYVYIGSNNKIILLNSSLIQLDRKYVSIRGVKSNSENSIWLLTTHNNDSLIVCSYQSTDRAQCLKYKILPDLSVFTCDAYRFLDLRPYTPATKYLTTTVKEISILIVASSKCLYDVGDYNCFAITSYYLENFDRFQLGHNHRYAVTYKEETKHVTFKAILEINNFIYILFNAEEGFSKLGKMCTGSTNSRTNSFEDTPIVCSHNGRIFTMAQDAVHWKG